MTESGPEYDDILLCQYLDEELEPEQRSAIEKRLQDEPDLRERLLQFQSVDSSLQSTVREQSSDDIPDSLTALLSVDHKQPVTNVLSLPTRRVSRLPLAAAAAIAVVSVSAGLVWKGQQSAPGNAPEVLNSVAFSTVMSESPSSTQAWYMLGDDYQLRPILSFPTASGYCREYQLENLTKGPDSAAWRGIACLEQQRWVTEVLTATTQSTKSQAYTPASADGGATDRFVAAKATGEALSVREEAGLIGRGWR
ncbi:MAG: hypothetical protein AAGI24_03050 [Pseudomonadota bacterium]